MESAAIDTTLLIDLQRGKRGEFRVRAQEWLEKHSTCVLKIPAIVLGEFSAGFADPDDEVLNQLRRRHEILPAGEAESLCFGSQYRKLKAEGALIGSHDLWIAATALSAGLPLVTRNIEHFGRVEGLEVEAY